MKQNNALVKGSVGDIAQRKGLTIAEAFMDAKAVIAIDTSGSMGQSDAGLGRTRYEAACEQLRRLQGEMPGEVAVVSFSSEAIFCPNGIPTNQCGGTDMAEALRFVKKCDGLMRIVIIGDGEPDDEADTLAVAATFTSKIDAIFIGNELSPGRDFMRRLAAATGGVSVANACADLDLLGRNVRLLLGAGA
jgi:hypothetical protein